MIVSKKFTSYYNTLSNDDKLKAMKIVCELCDEHAEMMDKKQQKLQQLFIQSNLLMVTAMKTKSLNEAEEIKKEMIEIEKEVKREAKFIPIERYIEINFGL